MTDAPALRQRACSWDRLAPDVGTKALRGQKSFTLLPNCSCFHPLNSRSIASSLSLTALLGNFFSSIPPASLPL